MSSSFTSGEARITASRRMSVEWITQGFQGMPSAFLRSKVAAAKAIETYSFRSKLAQAIKADAYRGKRVRFSGNVKAQHVEPQAGLTLDIFFSPHASSVRDGGKDDLKDRRKKPLEHGTHDWMRYETTILVPENAQYIHFGLILYGTGQIWLANARLEVTEQDGMPSA